MTDDLRQLWHKIQVKKYAESPPKKLLYHILHEIEMKKHYGSHRNWEILVELLAKWLVLNVDLTLAGMGPLKPFDGLDMKRDSDLFEHINSLDLFKHYYVAAKAKPWDYIGEVYQDLGLVGPGQNMTPKNVVDMMIQMTFGDPWRFEAKLFSYASYRDYLLRYYAFHHVRPSHLRPMEFPMQTQLDTLVRSLKLEPCVGTGRFLFEASIMYPEAPLVLFGVEINLALYRACLVNMAMFSNHAYSIICADSLRLGVTGPGHKVWDLGNRWDPPDMTPYYWKPTPPFQRYMKMRKPK